MKRSLIAFQALLASSAVLCQTAEASSTYTAQEQLTGPAKANSIEARIEAVRNTDWGSLLKDPEIEDELVAKSKWKNGKGNKFGNGYGKGNWGNGSNKFWEHGTLASSETNACRFGTQIPTQVLLERFEEGPPLKPLTPNPSGS